MYIRKFQESDLEATYQVRASTRQNPLSKEQLCEWGFTPESVLKGYKEGGTVGWVCEDNSKIVGFCSGNVITGEVIVIALLPEYEARGLGKQLLTELICTMKENGVKKIWLSASPDPQIRAHGFYRANGWKPTGGFVENGDEILVYCG